MMSLLACPFKDSRSVKQRFGDYPNNITAFSAIDACLIVIAAQGEDTWEGTYVTGIRSSLTRSATQRMALSSCLSRLDLLSDGIDKALIGEAGGLPLQYIHPGLRGGNYTFANQKSNLHSSGSFGERR